VVEFAQDVSLRTFSRVLGGKALSRDQTYLNALKAWSAGNVITGFLIHMIPFYAFRHMVSWPLVVYHKHVRQRRLHSAAKAHVIQRMAEQKLGMSNSEELDALHFAIQYGFQHAAGQGTPTSHQSQDLVAAQLWQLTWAGAQSPTMSLANMLVKVLETPAYGEALREEVKSAIETQGWSDAMLNHMPLLDSFIREVHRLYPIFPSASPLA
jgi:cytochrome P450